MLNFRLFLEAVEQQDIWFGPEGLQQLANWDSLDSQIKGVVLKQLARRSPEDQNEIFKSMSRVNPQTAKLWYQFIQKNGARLQAQAQAEREERQKSRRQAAMNAPTVVTPPQQEDPLVGFSDPSTHAMVDNRPGAVDRYLQQKVKEVVEKYRAADERTKARIIQAVSRWQKWTKDLFRQYVQQR